MDEKTSGPSRPGGRAGGSTPPTRTCYELHTTGNCFRPEGPACQYSANSHAGRRPLTQMNQGSNYRLGGNTHEIEQEVITRLRRPQCDREIERQLGRFEDRGNGEPPAGDAGKRSQGNAPRFDLRNHLHRMTGVDLTRIDGVDAHRTESGRGHRGPTCTASTWDGRRSRKAPSTSPRTPTTAVPGKGVRAARQRAAQLGYQLVPVSDGQGQSSASQAPVPTAHDNLS